MVSFKRQYLLVVALLLTSVETGLLVGSAFAAEYTEPAPKKYEAKKKVKKVIAGGTMLHGDSYTVFKRFPVDPLMTGWQNDGRKVTTILSKEELKRFYKKIAENPVYKRWKGETPDKRFEKEIAKHKIDFDKTGMAFLRYGMGVDASLSVEKSGLKDGVLKIKVSHQHQKQQRFQRMMAVMMTVAVAVDKEKINKVIFELPNNKMEQAVIGKKSK